MFGTMVLYCFAGLAHYLEAIAVQLLLAQVGLRDLSCPQECHSFILYQMAFFYLSFIFLVLCSIGVGVGDSRTSWCLEEVEVVTWYYK